MDPSYTCLMKNAETMNGQETEKKECAHIGHSKSFCPNPTPVPPSATPTHALSTVVLMLHLLLLLFKKKNIKGTKRPLSTMQMCLWKVCPPFEGSHRQFLFCRTRNSFLWKWKKTHTKLEIRLRVGTCVLTVHYIYYVAADNSSSSVFLFSVLFNECETIWTRAIGHQSTKRWKRIRRRNKLAGAGIFKRKCYTRSSCNICPIKAHWLGPTQPTLIRWPHRPSKMNEKKNTNKIDVYLAIRCVNTWSLNDKLYKRELDPRVYRHFFFLLKIRKKNMKNEKKMMWRRRGRWGQMEKLGENYARIMKIGANKYLVPLAARECVCVLFSQTQFPFGRSSGSGDGRKNI